MSDCECVWCVCAPGVACYVVSSYLVKLIVLRAGLGGGGGGGGGLVIVL